MEVAAILASAQAATQLAGTCYEIGTFLYGIRTTYKESSSTMRSIETECRIFQASVAHIQEWLQAQTQTSSSVTQIESVGSALGLINDSMKDMRKTLSKVTASRGTPMADRWVKAKFMMYEDALKAHLAELREHARLVQFTITTLQLQIPGNQPPSRPADTVSMQQVAAKAEAIRRSHTVKLQEQGNKHGRGATINQPPTSQDQAYTTNYPSGQSIATHHASRSNQPPRSNTTQYLPSRPAEGHVQLANQVAVPSKMVGRFSTEQDQWTMGGPAQANMMQDSPKHDTQSLPSLSGSFPTQSTTKMTTNPINTPSNQQVQESPSQNSAPSISGVTLVEHPEQPGTSSSIPSFSPNDGNTPASLQEGRIGDVSTSPKPSHANFPQAFGAAMTATPSSWDTWIPEMLAEPEDEIAPPLPDGPPEKPAGYASHVAELPTSFDDSTFKPKPQDAEVGQGLASTLVDLVARPQTEQPTEQSTYYRTSEKADNASLMTTSTGVSALNDSDISQDLDRFSLVSSQTAPSSRDPSIFSKPSSVWSSDTAFTTASSSSRLSQAPTLASTTSVRRKPIGVTKMGLQQTPISEDTVAIPAPMKGKMPLSDPTSQGNAVSGLTRHQSMVPDHPGMQFNRKHTSVSSPSVPTLSSIDMNVNHPDREEDPLIVRAASDGRGSMVEKLLASGADKNAVHPVTKRTALIEASEKGHANIVELLLDHACSISHIDSGGMSALHHAAQKGYLLVAKALLDRGAAVDIQGLNGLTPLYLASWAPHANMVMLLIQRQANVNARDAWQRTALHVAASRGFTNICTLLIDNGAQQETRDGDSKTPLQLSIGAQQLETVDLFLSRLKFRPTDTNFLTAFFAAIEAGHVRIAECFIDKGATLKGLKDNAHKPIVLASKSGNLDMVELVVKSKAKIKEKDPYGWTALHHAAHHGHAAIVERLVDKDIAASSTTSKKETPLHLAVKASNFAAADALLRGKGSSRVSSKDVYGQEPLHHAVRIGNMDMINLLLSNNANVSAENAFGWRPIHIAVAYNHLPIVTHLITHGASVDDRLSQTDLKKSETHTFVESGYWAEARWPFQGSKSIHLAIEFNRDDIARFLLSQGAKVDSACGEGWRPLHLAAFTCSVPMVEYLLSLGAYPHAVTDTLRQRTPLDIIRYRSQTSFSANPPGLPPATEADKLRIQELLNNAMAATPKKANEVWRKQMKILAGKGPEDKSENLRAASVAGDVVGMKRQMTTTTGMK